MPGKIAVRGELSLDGSGWQKTITQAGNQVSHFGNDILTGLKGQIAAAFGVGAIIEFGKRVVQDITHIKDMAEQFSITTDEVQTLGRAAEHIGLTFDDVGTAISRLGKARREAGEGNLDMLETFQKFGVEMRDIQDPEKRNVDLLLQMAEAMKGISLNPAQREELRDLFGRGGDKLAALFNEIQNMKPMELITSDQIEKIDKAKKDIQDIIRFIEAEAASPISKAAGIFNQPTFGGKLQAYFDMIEQIAMRDPLFRKFGGAGIAGALRGAYEGLGIFPGEQNIGNPPEPVPGTLRPGYSPPSGTGPMYSPKATPPQPLKFEDVKDKLTTDSLLRVGNFLGDNPKVIEVGRKQVELLTGIKDILNSIYRGMNVTSLTNGSTDYP